MPSLTLVGNSGQNILSGFLLWSTVGTGPGQAGSYYQPVEGIFLRWPPTASGNAYVSSFSGMTVNSGGAATSGAASGYFDGMLLAPGNSLFIPRGMLYGNMPASGNPVLMAACDPAASGVGRLYWNGNYNAF